MKYLLLTFSILFLSSCIRLTDSEIEEWKKFCELAGKDFYLFSEGHRYTCEQKEDKVQKCIDGYIDAIDEKYNNPDTVSDLREDDYSKVVKTCKETFWEKTPISDN